MNETDSRALRKRSRAVSDLNEEQIQYKRRVDRKAQRAFRQRIRDRISELELQVTELQETSRQRESQLQDELQSLREHNETLVRRLEGIARLATTGENLYSEDTSLHENQAGQDSTLRHEHVESPRISDTGAANTVVSVLTERECDPCSPQIAAPRGLRSVPTQIDSPIPVPRPVSDCDAAHPEIIEEPDPTYIASNLSTDRENGRTDSSENYHFPDPTLDATNSSLVNPETVQGFMAVPEPDPLSALLASSDPPVSETIYCAESRPVFTVLPAHMAPTCPLDRILTGFFNSRREMLSQGTPLDTVIGPQKASATALLSNEPSSSVHPLSRVMSEVMSTYPSVGKPEQLALFYLMHQTMRWQISSTKENYLFMPTWLRPTATQITVPHAAWIDNVPWPGVRDLLIEHPKEYPYSRWTENFTQNVSVNWNFDTSDAVSETDNGIVLHSIFEKHVRKIKVWAVSAEFARLFPNLMPAIHSCN